MANHKGKKKLKEAMDQLHAKKTTPADRSVHGSQLKGETEEGRKRKLQEGGKPSALSVFY